jgi:hypothetical protein
MSLCINWILPSAIMDTTINNCLIDHTVDRANSKVKVGFKSTKDVHIQILRRLVLKSKNVQNICGHSTKSDVLPLARIIYLKTKNKERTKNVEVKIPVCHNV